MFDEVSGQSRNLNLFPDDHPLPSSLADSSILVRLADYQLKRPRQYGACWLACELWRELQLDSFWSPRLEPSREGTDWAKTLAVSVAYRLIEPGSEWRCHRLWYERSAMGDLLGEGFIWGGKDQLYGVLDRLLQHRDELFQHLQGRWRDLFGTKLEVLLYDLTSTYFEGDVAAVPQARRGYSRDHRPDCKQLVLALVVTPEGFPLTYELFPGNRLDRTTLAHILDTLEKKFGKARRLWVFDRGIVSDDNLELLRQRGAHYLVGTPKSQLKAYEQKLLGGDWQKISDEVQVQLIPEADEVYVLCRSAGRVQKERAMRRRWLRRLIGDLRSLRRRVRAGQLQQRELIQRTIGRLQERHPQAWRWLKWELTQTDAGLQFDWDWERPKFQNSARAEGAYLLRAHWTERDPAKLWQTYVQLSEAEAAFGTLKSEVKVRPIWHWTEKRVEAHVLVAFLGYCLWVCLKKQAQRSAPSLTPWQILDQLGRIALVEVWFDLRDGRRMCLPRITQPEPAQALLLAQLNWSLPQQPPPRVYAQDLPPAPSPSSLPPATG